MNTNISDIAVGDVFSEKSFYRVTDRTATTVIFTHIGTGETVELDNDYVTTMLVTADQYEREEVVGKEDKYWTAKQIADLAKKGQTDLPVEGTLKSHGIRTIWDGIDASAVFTATYTKTDKPLSPKRYKELKEAQLANAYAEIEKASTGKKGVKDKALQALKDVQENPVLPYEPGEERVLRGSKKDFRSLTGLFDVYDLDILEKDNVRKLNVNTLKSIVVNGVKYTLE